MLILPDIYKSNSARHPYYPIVNESGWKTSLRVTLILNKSFFKSTNHLLLTREVVIGNCQKIFQNEKLDKDVSRIDGEKVLNKLKCQRQIPSVHDRKKLKTSSNEQ